MPLPPLLVRVPPPKSVVDQKPPATRMSPDLSTTAPESETSDPPHPLAHSTDPVAPESLAKAMPPILVKTLVPKTRVGELDCAARIMLPLPSTETERPKSP